MTNKPVCAEQQTDSSLSERNEHPTKPEKPTPRCPTCLSKVFSTERRPDGDSTCAKGHKHSTKDFYEVGPNKYFNTRLLAQSEVATVFEETGLTPSQLREQRDMLIEAMEEVRESIEDYDDPAALRVIAVAITKAEGGA